MECEHCDTLQKRVGELEAQVNGLTSELMRILPHLREMNGYLEISNAKIVATGHNVETILVLGANHASGWQNPIAIDGHVKCLSCKEPAYGEVFCDLCKEAILDMRAMGVGQLSALAEALSRGLLGDWVEEQLERMENGS